MSDSIARSLATAIVIPRGLKLACSTCPIQTQQHIIQAQSSVLAAREEYFISQSCQKTQNQIISGQLSLTSDTQDMIRAPLEDPILAVSSENPGKNAKRSLTNLRNPGCNHSTLGGSFCSSDNIKTTRDASNCFCNIIWHVCLLSFNDFLLC